MEANPPPPDLKPKKMPVAKLDAVKDALAIPDAVLAQRLGVTRQTISTWRTAGEIPTIVALALEALLPPQRHDVNANQVFKWRCEMWPEQIPAAAESIAMLPVEIVSEQPSDPRPRSRRSGVIEITFGRDTRVYLHGEVSPETLRQVIELLR